MDRRVHLFRLLLSLSALLLGVMSVVVIPSQAQTISFTPYGFAISEDAFFNPTSLQFGPDNRLYVVQQDATVWAYTIVRNGPSDYTITDTDKITIIKEDIPNYNDDGSFHNIGNKRQSTGLVVGGTAANPIIYVGSSDDRQGGGGSGADTGLDTNSGTISQLTWNGSSWDHVELIRGLPRSEENHANNGMFLDGNTLYVTIGGSTNAGAPSNNFAFITEYAYSGSIIAVDLAAINSLPTQTEQVAGQTISFKYNMPTLDDPSRPNVNGIVDPNAAGYNGIDVGDPFGGNDGLNQAKVINGGPISIHSTGWRNQYDVVVTVAGNMYSVDNGANGGWGGYPPNEGEATCTNDWISGEPGSNGPGPAPNFEPKVNNQDNLQYITGSGFYAGHPVPVRGNPAGAGLFTHDSSGGGGDGVFRTQILDVNDANFASQSLPVDWPPVPSANPIECDFLMPGVDDGALATWGASTNGITEYTASNFNNQLQGDLLTASFDGTIYRFDLTSADTGSLLSFASGFGATPLDVTAQGDNDIFPGTVWAVTYGADDLTVFEPADYDGGTTQCVGTDDITIDEDNDGYTNADEIDNGTDPCNAAEKPNDFDQTDDGSGFLVSDLNDPDDDNDGLSDAVDPYPIDATNGSNVNLPLEFELFNGFPGYGFYGLGFTGLMSNGSTDYLQLWDDSNVIAGGTAGLLTMLADDGTALNGSNDQLYGFQFGLNAGAINVPYTIEVIMSAPFFDASAGTPAEKYQGFYIGDGTQDNYLALAVDANGTIRTILEQGGASSSQFYAEGINLGGASIITLYMTVDPATNQVTTAYKVNSGTITDVGSAITVGGSIAAAMDGTHSISGVDSEMAIGVIATSGATEDFGATWDYISVENADGSSDNDPIYRVNAGGAEVADSPIVWTQNNPVANFSTGGTPFASPVTTNTTSAPDAVFGSERFGNQEWDFPVSNGTYEITFYLMEGFVNADNARIFDIEIEGVIPAAFDDFDIFEEAGFQMNLGFSRNYNVTVTDSNLDINFINNIDNAAIRGIEITPLGVTSSPSDLLVKDASGAQVSDVDFGSVELGVTSSPITITLDNIGTDDPIVVSDVSISGADAAAFSVSPNTGTTLNPNDVYTLDLTFTPSVAGAYSAVLTITHDGENGPTTVVNLAGNGYDPLSGTVLHRINVGGPQVAATDAPAPAWAADTAAAPSPFRVNATGGDNIFTTTATLDYSSASIPPYAPNAIFTSERWDAGPAPEMTWAFDNIEIGADLVVRLYFAEIFTGANTVGARVFDVAVEGTVPSVYDDIDQVAIAGLEGAFMLEHSVTVTDGVLNIDFLHAAADNPAVKAIEIIQVGSTSVPSDLVVKDDAGAPVTDIAFGTIEVGNSSDVVTVTLDNLGSTTPIIVSDIAITGADAAAFDVTPAIGTTLNPTDLYDLAVSFTPPAAGDYSATLTITHDGENGPTTVVNLTGTGYEEVVGTILHRINVGGPEVATANGTLPAWTEDSAASPSPFRIAATGGDNIFTTGAAIDMSSSSIPPYAPEAIFTSERWDIFGGAEMQWEFDNITPGSEIVVRLYFAETFDGAAAVGARVFDVEVEGVVPTVYAGIDQFAIAGLEGAFMLEHSVTVTDGTLDVDFLHGIADNPALKGIEVISLTAVGNTAPVIQPVANQFVEEGETLFVPLTITDADNDILTKTVEVLDATNTPVDAATFVYSFDDLTDELSFTPTVGTAGDYTVNITADDGTGEANAVVTESFVLTVTSGNSLASALVQVLPSVGIDSSTFVPESITIENTGDVPIVGATFDLSTTVLPNLVFDPLGTAGDAVAKCLSPDAGELETGYITPTGGNCDGFAAANTGLPFSGENMGGYDVMGMQFTADEFTVGEIFALSVDIDPTTIEGATTSGDAGSVSGLEIIGATVTIEFQDGTVYSTQLYTIPTADESGSQSNLQASVPNVAPTLAVQGVVLDANGAANLSYADPTLLVTGPANATVSVTQLDTGLLLTQVEQCGVALANYESNAVNGVVEYFVTLDAAGTGEVDATLFGTLNDNTDGLNYFSASVVDNSATPRLSGPLSNTVILSYPEYPNYAPVVNSTYVDTVMNDGEVLSLPLDACDVGTTVPPTFEVTVFEQGTTAPATFFTVTDNGDGTGLLNFAPTDIHVGVYDVSIVATDGVLDSVPVTFTLTVNSTTFSIDPIADQTVAVAASLTVPVEVIGATDVDLGFQVWNKDGAIVSPASSLFSTNDNGDGTGAITFSPSNNNVAGSPYDVTVTAQDDLGNIVTETFQVTVTSQSTVGIVSLTLFDADTDLPIPGFNPIPQNAVFNLATLPENITIVANTNPEPLNGPVNFNLNSGEYKKKENYVPYAMAGDSNGGTNLTPLPFTFSLGANVLKVNTPAGTNLTLNFTVIDQAGNAAPVADAGADIIVVDNDDDGGEIVTLDGSGSSDDVAITSYTWTNVSGAIVGNAVTVDVAVPVDTSETFTLTVTDAEGESSSDSVVVTVEAAPPNLPPVVNPIADQSDPTGAAVSLQVVATDSDPLAYTATGLPTGLSISSTGVISGTISAAPATYPVSISVTDNVNAPVLVTFDWTVTEASSNGVLSLTLYDAVTDQVIPGYDPIPQGAVLNQANLPTYWAIVANTNPYTISGGVFFDFNNGQYTKKENFAIYAMFGNNGNNLSGAIFPTGNHTLVVTPGTGSAYTLNFTVVNQAGNVAPNADAGDDITVVDSDDNGSETVILDGTGSGDDAGIVSYEWKNANGVVISNSATTSVTVTAGTSVDFTLTVADAQGETDSDSVNVTVEEVGQTQEGVISFTLYNAVTNQPIAGYDPIPQGAVLNQANLPTYWTIVANTNPGTVDGGVWFIFNGGTYTKKENIAPYALLGDNNGNFAGAIFPLGNHTLEAIPGEGSSYTLNFTVIDN